MILKPCEYFLLCQISAKLTIFSKVDYLLCAQVAFSKGDISSEKLHTKEVVRLRASPFRARAPAYRVMTVWHIQDSLGQILAWDYRQQPVKAHIRQSWHIYMANLFGCDSLPIEEAVRLRASPYSACSQSLYTLGHSRPPCKPHLLRNQKIHQSQRSSFVIGGSLFSGQACLVWGNQFFGLRSLKPPGK